MTDLNAIIQQVRQHLAEAGIGSADTEAASIAAHVLQVDRGRLGVLQVLGQSIAQSTSNQIWALVEARKRRIPLQHLTGVAGFYGLDIQTGPGVFIPRPETEILVETTLRSEEHTSEIQSRGQLVCRLRLERKTWLLRADRRHQSRARASHPVQQHGEGSAGPRSSARARRAGRVGGSDRKAGEAAAANKWTP